MCASVRRWSQTAVTGAIAGFAFFSPWSIAGAQICLGLGLAAWMVSLFAKQAVFSLTPLGWPVLAFLGAELLSALFSPDPAKGLAALRAEWIVALFFLAANNVSGEKTARRALDVLVAVTVLVSWYAIWQHFAGWDIYRGRALRPTGDVFEATGLFGHHLTFGGYVMVVLIVVGCLSLWGSQGWRRLAYAMASLCLGLALLFSYARSAWLGLVGGVLAIGFLRGRRALLLGLAGVVLTAALVFLVQPSVRIQARELVNQLQDPMVTSSRWQMWSAALHMIRDHPLLGVGLGRVRESLPAYGCNLGYAHPHNDLLNVAANAGLLGLAAFLWIWIRFLKMAAGCLAQQGQQRMTQALSTAGFGLMIAFLVAGLFQCYCTDAEDGMILWFLLGLVTAVCGPGRQIEPHPRLTDDIFKRTSAGPGGDSHGAVRFPQNSQEA